MTDQPPPTDIAAVFDGEWVEADPAATKAVASEAETVKANAADIVPPFDYFVAGNQPWHDIKRLIPGGDFVFTTNPTPITLWGDDDHVLWADNETLLAVGPVGIGKTTLMEQLAIRRHRSDDNPADPFTYGELLGLPVERDDKPGLYLAMDRPDQIARSLRRMVEEGHRDDLNDRLRVWRGKLPFDIGKDPEGLANMAADIGAGSVYIDSLKNIRAEGKSLSTDEGGGAVEDMWQALTLAGIQVVATHHQRKKSGNKDAPKPKTIDDVFGSVWITSAAGSVVLLWGKPGDVVIDFEQLKTPAGEPVTGWRLTHDTQWGTFTKDTVPDAYDIVQDHPGITTAEVARNLYGTDDRNQLERARRRLSKLEDRNRLKSKPQPKPQPTRWYPVDWDTRPNHAPNHAPEK